MKTETEKELRELDAWIAEHVMEWSVLIGRNAPPSKRVPPYSREDVEDYGVWVVGDSFKARCYQWHPTTNPADAMVVLERCAESRSIIVNKEPDGSVSVAELKRTPLSLLSVHLGVNAETFPLAICKFAKALYSK